MDKTSRQVETRLSRQAYSIFEGFTGGDLRRHFKSYPMSTYMVLGSLEGIEYLDHETATSLEELPNAEIEPVSVVVSVRQRQRLSDFINRREAPALEVGRFEVGPDTQ